MSPLFWILASTWAFFGLSGGVAFCVWTIVDKPLQRDLDTKLALHAVKEVSPPVLAFCICGISLVLIPVSAITGPLGLAWTSNLLYSATNERISIVQGEE
jgi:hypothetical protein